MTADLKKILVITDGEFDLAGELSKHLGKDDYEALHALDAVTALTLALREKPVLILLDPDLSDGNAPKIKKLLGNFRFLKQTPIYYLKNGKISKTFKPEPEVTSLSHFKKFYSSKKFLETIKAILSEKPPSS